MSDEKKPPTPVPDVAVETGSEDLAMSSGSEADIINILGYKPELRRNRSMFTLLFQSLAIAAVSPIPWMIEPTAS